MIQHVLFVCTGNICRSPLAESLLERASRSAASNGRDVGRHRGVDGAPASEGAYLVGLERASISRTSGTPADA